MQKQPRKPVWNRPPNVNNAWIKKTPRPKKKRRKSAKRLEPHRSRTTMPSVDLTSTACWLPLHPLPVRALAAPEDERVRWWFHKALKTWKSVSFLPMNLGPPLHHQAWDSHARALRPQRKTPVDPLSEARLPKVNHRSAVEKRSKKPNLLKRPLRRSNITRTRSSLTFRSEPGRRCQRRA